MTHDTRTARTCGRSHNSAGPLVHDDDVRAAVRASSVIIQRPTTVTEYPPRRVPTGRRRGAWPTYPRLACPLSDVFGLAGTGGPRPRGLDSGQTGLASVARAGARRTRCNELWPLPTAISLAKVAQGARCDEVCVWHSRFCGHAPSRKSDASDHVFSVRRCQAHFAMLTTTFPTPFLQHMLRTYFGHTSGTVRQLPCALYSTVQYRADVPSTSKHVSFFIPCTRASPSSHRPRLPRRHHHYPPRSCSHSPTSPPPRSLTLPPSPS